MPRAASQRTHNLLSRYQEKRDFTQTAEPSGRLAVSASPQLRFVIQKHAASHLHYDLRLELDGVFKSWAVTKGPSIDPSAKRLAVEVEDHPLDYGDFEGTIPKGQYGGGTVQLWDRGFWTPLGNKSPEDALKSGELKFALEGNRLQGSWVLVRLKNDRFGNKRTNWLLIKSRDEFAKAAGAQTLLDLDRSVASGRSMTQIAKGKGRSPEPFMLATKAMKADAVWRGNRRAGHEVVLGGWTTESGGLRSLLAGVNRDGHLVYIGRIGTGFGAAVAAKLLPTLRKMTRESTPFGGANAPKKETNIRWLKPTLVAEIEFAGWTATGMIRQASFKGLRRDKPASEVIAEMPSPVESNKAVADEKLAAKVKTLRSKKPVASGPRQISAARAHETQKGVGKVMGVTLSKPDKVLWPDAGDAAPVSKLDLAQYYEAVGEWMMPHLKGRPCSLVRAPDGLGGEQFFQRHAMAGISNLFSLVKVKGDKAPYVQIDRVEALAAVAQIGALEIHPWNCAPDNPEVAGRLVFDFDPAPDVKFAAVIEAALEIRERLKKVGLESFCKTTGGKGLHVVTPLKGGKDAVPWPAAKDFAHIICAQMAQDSPTKYLDTMSKKDRVGRIFLDYLRNDRTSTAVAVLSSRARAGAPISMPIHWKEVKAGLSPARYTVRTGPAILRKSKPWDQYFQAAQSLASAVRQIAA